MSALLPGILQRLRILGAMDEMRAAWDRLGLIHEGEARNVAVRSVETIDDVVTLTCFVKRDGLWSLVWRMEDSDRAEACEALATWWVRRAPAVPPDRVRLEVIP